MNGTDARTVLENNLRSTTSPWDRLPILIALVKELYIADPQSIHRYAMEAYTIAKELNDPFWIATSLGATSLDPIRASKFSDALPILQKASRIYARINDIRAKADTDHIIARIYTSMGEYPQAMKMLLEILNVFQSIDAMRETTHALFAIGDIHRQTGNWVIGFKYYLKAEKFIKRSGSKSDMAKLYHRLAASYQAMEDIERYRSYMLKSLRIYSRNADKPGMAVALGNIANSYLDQERFAEAEKYVKLSGKLYHELGYPHYEALAWARLGSIYEHRQEFEVAYGYFRKGIRLMRESEFSLIRGQLYENFGRLCILMGRTEQGFRYLRKAIPLIERTGHPQHLYKAYEELATACETIGNTQEALEYYKTSMRIKNEYIDSQKVMEASYAEMRTKFKPIVQKLKKERTKNNTLKKIIEQKEAQLLSLTLGMIQDEEERSNTKLQGPAKRSEGARGNRSNGLSKNWETFNRQFHKVHHEFYTNLIRKFPELSPTEMKVCSLIRIGLSSKEIAGVLCISPRTVESHRMHVHRKMNLPSGKSLTGFIARL